MRCGGVEFGVERDRARTCARAREVGGFLFFLGGGFGLACGFLVVAVFDLD